LALQVSFPPLVPHHWEYPDLKTPFRCRYIEVVSNSGYTMCLPWVLSIAGCYAMDGSWGCFATLDLPISWNKYYFVLGLINWLFGALFSTLWPRHPPTLFNLWLMLFPLLFLIHVLDCFCCRYFSVTGLPSYFTNQQDKRHCSGQNTESRHPDSIEMLLSFYHPNNLFTSCLSYHCSLQPQSRFYSFSDTPGTFQRYDFRKLFSLSSMLSPEKEISFSPLFKWVLSEAVPKFHIF
jgi:hypothetical protein